MICALLVLVDGLELYTNERTELVSYGGKVLYTTLGSAGIRFVVLDRVKRVIDKINKPCFVYGTRIGTIPGSIPTWCI